jgi:para-aminobenzoate synthetase component 1
MDTSIAIRTLSIAKSGKKRRATFPVGGGIVADSDPEAEYEESLLKAQAFFCALSKDKPSYLESDAAQ